jgi:hypothetical protein
MGAEKAFRGKPLILIRNYRPNADCNRFHTGSDFRAILSSRFLAPFSTFPIDPRRRRLNIGEIYAHAQCRIYN